MINERSLYLHTPLGPPSLPRIERLVWERASTQQYRHSVAQRSQRQAVVQITLAGAGAIFDQHGAIIQRCAVGQALIFLTGEHPLIYGYPTDVTAGQPHWDFVYANFDGAIAHLIIADLVAANGHVLNMPADHAVVSELLALIPNKDEAHRHVSAAGNARLSFDVLSALVELNATEPNEEQRLLEQAQIYLQRHLDKSIGIHDVAQHCQVSREHLSRCFTRLLGEGPAAWLRRQRLNRAERLLLTSDQSIAAIATQCGFASASHFARSFRQHSGCEPRRFRDGAGN